MRKIGIVFFISCLLVFEMGCGDQYRPVANPIIGPGGQPQTTHFAFVVNYNPVGPSTTTKLDVSGDTNVETQSVGKGAVTESFLSHNTTALFTANNGNDSVSEFSTITNNNPVTTINLLAGSKPVAIGSEQSGLEYVLNSGTTSVCPNSGSVSSISVATLVVLSTTCVGTNPTAMSQLPNGTKLFILNQGNNSISVYDPGSQSIVDTLDSTRGLSPNAVAMVPSADSNYLFVVAKGDGVNPGILNIVTTSSDAVAASLPLGVSPVSIYFDATLNRLYIPNSGSNTVTVLDASTVNVNNQPPISTLATASVGTSPVAVTALPNASKVYVANSGSNNVTVLSATSFATLTTVPTGINPIWIASEPSSTKVYTANQGSGNVTIIRTSNDAVAATINAPQQDPNCTSSCALQQPMMILTY